MTKLPDDTAARRIEFGWQEFLELPDDGPLTTELAWDRYCFASTSWYIVV
jgi:hypothetical protein